MSGIRVLLNYFGIISLYHCLLCLFVYQVSQLVNYYAFAWLGCDSCVELPPVANHPLSHCGTWGFGYVHHDRELK